MILLLVICFVPSGKFTPRLMRIVKNWTKSGGVSGVPGAG